MSEDLLPTPCERCGTANEQPDRFNREVVCPACHDRAQLEAFTGWLRSGADWRTL